MGTTKTEAPRRSLADELRGRSDDDLAALLRVRPDLVNPVPVDVAQLAARATTRASILRVIDRLDRFSLHVVDAIAILPEPVTQAAIGDLLGVPESAVGEAIGELRTAAIVWGGDDDLRMVRAAHEIVGPYPAGLGPPLRQALTALPPSRLAQLAAGFGLDHAGDPVTDTHVIADAITNRIDHIFAELGEESIEALRKLAMGPPTGRVDDAQREVDIRAARTPIDALLARGLLVPVDAGTVVLPREIGLHLRGGLLRAGISSEPPEPPGMRQDATTVDRTAGAGAFEAVRRVEELLDAWSADPRRCCAPAASAFVTCGGWRRHSTRTRPPRGCWPTSPTLPAWSLRAATSTRCGYLRRSRTPGAASNRPTAGPPSPRPGFHDPSGRSDRKPGRPGPPGFRVGP